MLTSMIEMTPGGLKALIESYIKLAENKLNKTIESSKSRAFELVTRRRFMGLLPPLAKNPTLDEAMDIARKKLNYHGYSLSEYCSMRIQAKMFEDMINSTFYDAKIFVSVEDHHMLMTGGYSSKAYYNSGQWNLEKDPNLADY